MKKICFVIFMLLLASMTLGCEQEAVSSTDTTSSAANGTTTAAETERQPYVDKHDYNGAEFHIITGSDYNSTYLNNLFSDEETGDSLNDAVYRRFQMTDEYFNINITYDRDSCDESQVDNAVQKAVMSGDDSYQLVLANNMRDNASYILNNLLLDWNDIKSVDFSHPYWDSSVINALTVKGHVFFTKNSYLLPVHHVFVFNKEMAKANNFGNLYDMVRDGSWTLDKMFDMAKSVTGDTNGDGKMDINDTYGISCMCDIPLNSFLFSSGQNLTKIGDDGLLKLCVNNEKTISLYEKIYKYFVEDSVAYTYPWAPKLDSSNMITIDSGRALFRIELTASLNQYRAYNVDYGILPYPKYDTNQDGYYIESYGKFFTIPKSVKDPEMSGAVCEMLGYYTDKYVLDAYYNDLLNTKVCRDEDSIEMLKIASDGIICDAGMTFFGLMDKAITSYMYYPARTIVMKKSDDFASFYKASEQQALAEIEAFYSAVED